MKITYDSETDSLYIRLIKGEPQCRTLMFSDGIALNIGSKERLIGIEILDASSVLGHDNATRVVLENVVVAIEE